MNKIGFLFFFGITLSCLGQSPPGAPAGNPTQFPSGDAAWTIDITQKNSGGAGQSTNGRMKKIEITQLSAIQRVVIDWLNGKTTERWHYNSLQITFDTDTPTGDPIGITDGNSLFVRKTGFEGASFSWISPIYFQGIVSYQGKNCYHYKGKITIGRDGVIHPSPGPSAPGVDFEAWIDQQTDLPVGLDDGSQVGNYTFQKDPPTGSLTPPKVVADAYLRYSVPLVPQPNPRN